MRLETWLARLVFVLGAFVMIATSSPGHWGESKSLEAELQSEGQGDDKLVRIRVRLTEGLATDARHFSVRLSGSVDRPASDLTLVWLHGNASMPGPAVPQAFSTSNDFLTVYASSDLWAGCYGGRDACAVSEGRIATESSEAYSMTLAIHVSVSGSKEKQPRGEMEVSVEVLDAPDETADAPQEPADAP